MTEHNLSSTPLNEIQNHDDFQVVWFSLEDNISNEVQNFAEYLKPFKVFKECDQYIKKIHSTHKILLVLIDMFEYVSYFNDLPQIQSIYVLKRNLQNVQGKYSKLIGIFEDEHMLIERLRQDILLTFRHDLPSSISSMRDMTIDQSFTNLDETALKFLWNFTLIHYLIDFPLKDMDLLKQDMIDQCRLEYQDNSTYLSYINNFAENSTNDNVLNWYTADSFAYRLVNRAFRTRDIDLICKFRYFITLLYSKLRELAIKQQERNYTTVYRGQSMTNNELNNIKSNVGHLISINSIMSTTRDESIARSFIVDANVGVLFEIDIASADKDSFYPFSDISKFSLHVHEEEILFFPGGVFRIDSVEKENNSTWAIKLSLNTQTIVHTKSIMDCLAKKFTSVRNLYSLLIREDDIKFLSKYYRILTDKSFSVEDLITDKIGFRVINLFNILGDYVKTIEFYNKLLLVENFIDDAKFIVLHILIGYNYFRLFEYDKALEYYNTAVSLLSDGHRLIGEIYNHIGDVEALKNNFQMALVYYQEGLQILSNHHIKQRHISRIHRKISCIYRNENNYEDAIMYDQQADELDRNSKHLSYIDHDTSINFCQNLLNTGINLSPPQQADILFSMGGIFLKKGEYHQALEKFNQAKELFERNLPPYETFPRKFGKLFENIAWIHLLLKEYLKALVMWKKAIDIRTSFS